VAVVPPRAGDSQALSPFLRHTRRPASQPGSWRGNHTSFAAKRSAVGVSGRWRRVAVTIGFVGSQESWGASPVSALLGHRRSGRPCFLLAVSAPTAALAQLALPAIPVAFLVMVVFGVPAEWRRWQLGGLSVPGLPARVGLRVATRNWPASALRDAVCTSRGPAPKDERGSWRSGLAQESWLWWSC